MSEAPTCIAVVEDDDDVRETVGDLLASEGYAVLQARNGREALELLRRADPLPCVILLDLMMPVMDGAEFRAQQLVDPRLQGIPVVLLSANTQLSAIVVQLGVAEGLAKPISLQALLDVAARYADLAHASHATLVGEG